MHVVCKRRMDRLTDMRIHMCIDMIGTYIRTCKWTCEWTCSDTAIGMRINPRQCCDGCEAADKAKHERIVPTHMGMRHCIGVHMNICIGMVADVCIDR